MNFRIVIAPSGVNNDLTADQVAESVKQGILRVAPNAEVVNVSLTQSAEGSPLTQTTSHPRSPSLTLDTLLREADLVFTIEGNSSGRTPPDSGIAEVTRRAQRLHLPVIAMVGTIGTEAWITLTCSVDAETSLPRIPCTVSAPLASVGALLEDCAEQIMRLIVVGRNLSRREDQSVTPAWQTALAARVNALRKPVPS